MKPLSEQLETLSERAKHTEDVAAAAREKDRGELEARKTALTASITATAAKVRDETSAARDRSTGWWSDVRSSVDAKFAAMRARAEERRAEHDVRKAEHAAEDAEADAADAIDLALSLLDQAEYAVIDAILARAEADDLAGRD